MLNVNIPLQSGVQSIFLDVLSAEDSACVSSFCHISCVIREEPMKRKEEEHEKFKWTSKCSSVRKKS